MHNINSVCVFASSSDLLPKAYYELAAQIGAQLAKNGITMVFGAGSMGLMGAAARAAYENGGKQIGVLPEKMNLPGIAYENMTKLIITETMHERKRTMEELSSAFIVLPGGFGTLEELLEVLTLKQLGYHNKPVIIINISGCFDPLLEHFELMFASGFADIGCRELYRVAHSAKEAMICLKQYVPPVLTEKVKATAKE